MSQNTLDYLESHQSGTPSHWREEAEWRRDNREWLHYSKRIAVMLLSYMKRGHLTQSAMAERLDCTQQYVSKILKGTENLSLETLAKLESAMGERLIAC
ncbi:MAG: helix-turn-helix transcriptional regulator [Bacteroidales bacterium]|nr:helix-turn-helix transcriptional regulator [Bacteroidales bacterium]